MSERQASTYARKTGTRAHNMAMAILSSFLVPYESEFELLRPMEQDAGGKQLWYSVDVLCYPQNSRSLALELEGAGSKSSDNERRDAFLRANGMDVLHVPNRTVLKTPLKFAALVALAVVKFDAWEGERLCRAICERLAAAR